MMNKLKPALLITLMLGIGALAVKAQTTVTLDYFYNHESHKNKDGQIERFHYMWEETDLNGYSIWGAAFTKYGAKLNSLDAAPTWANLKATDIYIIVDMDSKKEAETPNYIDLPQVKTIADWVKAGGTLVILANDSANVNLPGTNKLANAFGLHFNDDIQNHVVVPT